MTLKRMINNLQVHKSDLVIKRNKKSSFLNDDGIRIDGMVNNLMGSANFKE